MAQDAIDKDQLVFGYWNVRGLAEPSRLTLHYTKTPYTDKMYHMGDAPEYSRDEWLSEKFKLDLVPNFYLFKMNFNFSDSLFWI
ncbi:unnamed protein product [Rotaria sp. Silwood1]|nr:unnamed protein product [Rotaria sp. Silwood1]